MNTQAQTHPIKNVDDPVQHIAEEMMVELQHTYFGIQDEIFFMETLFSAYANKVVMYPFMAYKSMVDTYIIYLHESMKKPD